MFSMWTYVAMAALIAIAGFGAGQAFPGLGVPFVILASTIWTAYSVNAQRRFRGSDC
jgi:hypothetical protein